MQPSSATEWFSKVEKGVQSLQQIRLALNVFKDERWGGNKSQVTNSGK